MKKATMLCDWCGNYPAIIARENQKICQYCYSGYLMNKMDKEEKKIRKPWKVCHDNTKGERVVIMHGDACKYWPQHTVISSHATEMAAKKKANEIISATIRNP